MRTLAVVLLMVLSIAALGVVALAALGRAVVPCHTDSECAARFGGNGDHE